MLEESVVVHGDDVVLEAVGRQGGAAGVLGAELLGGEVQIEIDAADPNELCTVRVWHDGAVSPAAASVLDTLFGARSMAIQTHLANDRPVRLPGSESRRMTSFRGGVPYELQSFVAAADGLTRVGVPDEVRAMLDLVRHVYALQSNLPSALEAAVDPFLLSLALAGASEDSYRLLRVVLDDAVRIGVLTRPELDGLLRGQQRDVLEFEQLTSANAISLANLSVERLLSTSDVSLTADLYGAKAGDRCAVYVHESSLFGDAVRWSWAGENNLEVRVAEPGAGTLWVRVWLDGVTPVAAVPLQADRGWGRALLLIPPQAHEITLDVASSLDQRLLGRPAVALERAYSFGRQAARTERCVGEMEADTMWRACSQAHEVAGDYQRSKMAAGRPGLRRAVSPATAADHLLL